MEYYPIQKMLKENKQLLLLKATLSKDSPHNTPRKGNAKEEFLKQYYQPQSLRRLDQEFTLSWANKQFEKNKDAKPLSLHNKTLSSSALINNEQTKNSFPLISISSPKMSQSSLFKSFDLRKSQINESNVEDNVTSNQNLAYSRYVTEPHKGLTIEIQANSHRVDSQKTPTATLETHPDTSHFSKTAKNTGKNWVAKRNSSVENDGVFQSLEDIYYEDLKKKDEVVKSSDLVSPYRKRAAKYKKAIEIKLDRVTTHIADDKVLMNKFEDPYASKIPFDKPINASFRNQKNAELSELETKIQILRNLKSMREGLTKESNLISPKTRHTKLVALEMPSNRDAVEKTKVSPKVAESNSIARYYTSNKKTGHKRSVSHAMDNVEK